MSVIIPKEGSTIYINIEKKGSIMGENENDTINEYADTEITFPQPIFEAPKQWIMRLRRFRIPLQNIPFNQELPADDPPGANGANSTNYAVRLVNRGTNNHVSSHALKYVYSLGGLMTELNSMVNTLWFVLQPDGRMGIEYTGYNNHDIILHQNLADMFSVPKRLTGTAANINHRQIIGSASCLDKIDQLDRIEVYVQGITATPEFDQGGHKSALLTDYVFYNSYSVNHTYTMHVANANPALVVENRMVHTYSISDQPRQDLISPPQNDQWITLKTDTPCRRIRIYCRAKYKGDGISENHKIYLPSATVMSFKLQFITRL